MKKIGMVLCVFLFMISMTACSLLKDNPVHLGVNAVITEIDEGNNKITAVSYTHLTLPTTERV